MNSSEMEESKTKRHKSGRFSWVKRLIQSRNNSNSATKPIRKTSTFNPNNSIVHSDTYNINDDFLRQPNDVDLDYNIKFTTDLKNEDNHSLPNTASTHNSIPSRTVSKSIKSHHDNSNSDNYSTLPIISLSTVSIRSSAFSEVSRPSTTGTTISDHQTVYTNSSTIAIPPASILDRNRNNFNYNERNTNRLNSFYFGNNSSNNTFLTTTSPRSIHHNDVDSISIKANFNNNET
ncbi:hypothetical protein WICMUC_005478 [Wickerhamomyces mucosus]|uniref:Uncharacterized protein n=1 Tax=Wickerhamomyces mucosus TaxID=1378264 RepID=A0A9P8T5C8_9ASCO|nr:hypothetical protein WICMUC_005478 [Wickerhamomyces mucosus]